MVATKQLPIDSVLGCSMIGITPFHPGGAPEPAMQDALLVSCFCYVLFHLLV